MLLWDLKNLKSNLSENVKNIFIYLDIIEDVMQQNIVNLKNVKLEIIRYLKLIYSQPMIFSFMPKFKRLLFAQFKTSALPLHIKTGCCHLTKDPKSKTYRKLNVKE